MALNEGCWKRGGNLDNVLLQQSQGRLVWDDVQELVVGGCGGWWVWLLVGVVVDGCGGRWVWWLMGVVVDGCGGWWVWWLVGVVVGRLM